MNKVVILLLVLTSFGAAAAPAIRVDSPEFSITLQTNSLVSHTFVLRNAGDETLTINRVSTSCGCTTAALSTQELGPGQSVDLAATVNTRGFKGTVARTVSVYSNDPVTPITTLRIVVTIAEPPAIVIHETAPAELLDMLYLLIDVRTPDEYAAGHLVGALNVPLTEFQTNLTDWLPRLPRDIPIILYDQTGVGSLEAATLLVQAGLLNVSNLTGGLVEWSRVNGDGFLYAF